VRRKLSLPVLSLASTLLVLGVSSASAQAILGTSQSFAVLGGSTVTNTGPSIIMGNLGLSPGTAVTGFPPGIVLGAMHITDAVALQAQNDANTAFNTLAGTAPNFDLTGQDLGGLTLTPGVYSFATSAQLTGALALDALGDESAVFVFQIGSTLTTASNSTVTVVNGASGCNVFWQIGSSATLGTATSFVGNILATASITVATAAVVSGRVIALNGAVTLDSNDISIPLECQCVVESGDGCAGTGVFVPELSITCPIPGSNTTLEIDQGLGGAAAILFFGQPSDHPICGCTLLVRPGPYTYFIDLSGSGAGNGSVIFDIPVPADAPSGTFALQVFVIDAGAPCGFSSSGGVIVTID